MSGLHYNSRHFSGSNKTVICVCETKVDFVSPLSTLFYCLCKALIIQFLSYKLFKSGIILHTQYGGIFKIAAVLSIAYHGIVFK